jgi:hypothetical protein
MLRILALVAVLLAPPLTAPTAGTLSRSSNPSESSGGLTVQDGRFVDSAGRDVVLRGFNVSGEVKLAENGGLPFANAADAQRSAVAMRDLTGANAVRLLMSWEAAEPVRGQLDQGYLARLTDQLRAFLDAGFYVFVDYHQDLYSRYLFNGGSWYTGNGAPKWVVDGAGYPKEYCGICAHWGQNITQNGAVQDATRDFWKNRQGVQDMFVDQAVGGLRYLREHLTPAEFARVVGVDPHNEPYAGRYDSGQNSQTWERDVLWPFYLKFRAAMDAAGWQDKPAFVQPNMYWNANLDFVRQPGGLANVGTLGSRYVFNTHFYDQKAMSGVFMWGKAGDGQYSTDFATVRQRAAALGTPAIVSEFGSPNGSDKTPTVLKAMYQALDSRIAGKDWWTGAKQSGPVLSATQWQWDFYSGRHHEVMNGNPDKIKISADAWNDEDFSLVATDDTGTPGLRADPRVLDRIYPAAVAGQTVAFTYEDRARDGSTTLTWNRIPAGMPNVGRLVGSGQYAVLAWHGRTADGPTELHLPTTFTKANTTVVSDAAASVTPGRLALTAGTGSHYALVANGPTPPTADVRSAAQRELAAWAATLD